MKFSLLTLALITPLLSTPVPQDNFMGPSKPPVKVAASSKLIKPIPKPVPKPFPKPSPIPNPKPTKTNSFSALNAVKSSNYPTNKAANFDSVPESNLVSPSIYPRIIPFYSHQFPQKYPAKQPISIKPISNKPGVAPNVVKSSKTSSQISQKNLKSSSKNPAKKSANFDSVPESNLVSLPTHRRIIPPFYTHQTRQPTFKNVKSSSKAKSANLQEDFENSMQDAVDGTEDLEA